MLKKKGKTLGVKFENGIKHLGKIIGRKFAKKMAEKVALE